MWPFSTASLRAELLTNMGVCSTKDAESLALVCRTGACCEDESIEWTRIDKIGAHNTIISSNRETLGVQAHTPFPAHNNGREARCVASLIPFMYLYA